MTTVTAIDPRNTALLVMDYQAGVINALHGGNDVDALLRRVAAAISTARNAGAKIVYVRAAFTDDDLDAVPETNKVFAPGAAARANHHEHPESAVHELLAPEPGDLVIRKTRLGAFSTSDLDDKLREAGITNLILAGVFSRGVLLATAVEGVDRDFGLYVLADASADPDPAVHEMLVGHVFSSQAHVIQVEDLSALLGQ